MKCVSSCFSCLCGSRNSSRISPSEPIQIIQANQEKYKSTNGCDIEEKGEVGVGNVNPNFSLDDDDLGEDSAFANLKVKALYIEVGKERLLRVIHIPSIEESQPSSRKGSVNKDTLNPEEKSTGEGETEQNSQTAADGALSPPPDENKEEGEGDPEDDEEEYWFSKWARKPRFRSIFSKNTDQRQKQNESNNNELSPEENSELTAKMEMARAAAAAKRRAWAYNCESWVYGNGNNDSAITQQPTTNPNDEEEFNSIAIVNSSKQQWTKGAGSSSGSEDADKNPSPMSKHSSKAEVEVSVENHVSERSASMNEGVSNPAFQDDEDENEDNHDGETNLSENKTEENSPAKSNDSVGSSTGEQSTASVKSSPSLQEEDAIISELEGGNDKGNSPEAASSNGPVNSSENQNQIIPANKKPLLFLIHSISGSSDVWLKQMEFFQQLGYEIVAPDLLGHGLSSTPLNPKYYLFESLVQDLILIFDHFTKENMKVVLIGHGYGACLAAMLSRVRLKNIALLITIAGGGPTPLVRRTCCQDSWFAWKCKLFHSNRIRGRFDNPELKHVLPPAIHRNVLSGQVWADGDSAFYRRVTVPTLLVYGMRDKVVTLVEECEMERTIPKSFLELIDSASHMVMLDEPDRLNKMLCKFIQSWA